MEMGCYGIGITRIVAAAIEQNHDERGIVFPRRSRLSRVCIVPIGYHKNAAVREAAERLYAELSATGVDVLLEDRDARPGVLFADMDLIGVPHRVGAVGARACGGERRIQGAARRRACGGAHRHGGALPAGAAVRRNEARASRSQCCSPLLLALAGDAARAAARPSRARDADRAWSPTAPRPIQFQEPGRRSSLGARDVRAAARAHPRSQGARRAVEDRAVRGDARRASIRNSCSA